LAEGVVDFLEYLAGDGEVVGEGLAHADGLTALAGKEERERHGRLGESFRGREG
jgi:hypothetical protein